MGIRGLKSFLEKNDFLQPYRLKDTRIVIDGNNICHQLLYSGTARHYGGNYSEVRQKVKSFFEALLSCNIKPYVVFDGAYDDDDKKTTPYYCKLRVPNERKRRKAS